MFHSLSKYDDVYHVIRVLRIQENEPFCLNTAEEAF